MVTGIDAMMLILCVMSIIGIVVAFRVGYDWGQRDALSFCLAALQSHTKKQEEEQDDVD